MLMLSAREVAQCLPMLDAIAGLRRAFAAWEQGHAQQPLRTQLNVPEGPGISLIMPAYLADSHQASAVVKVVSVFPGNPAKGLPVIHGLVLLIHPETGAILAGMDGGALTAIRTGAVSGLATDILAPGDAHSLALFGAGVQARTRMPCRAVTWYVPPPLPPYLSFTTKMWRQEPISMRPVSLNRRNRRYRPRR